MSDTMFLGLGRTVERWMKEGGWLRTAAEYPWEFWNNTECDCVIRLQHTHDRCYVDRLVAPGYVGCDRHEDLPAEIVYT